MPKAAQPEKPLRTYSVVLNPRQKGVEPPSTTVLGRSAYIDHHGNLIITSTGKQMVTSWSNAELPAAVAAFRSGFWISFTTQYPEFCGS